MRPLYSILVAGVIAATGCASSEYANRPPLTGDPIIDGKNNIQFGPKKDRVLWEYRVALAALRRGDYAEAKQQLDGAIMRIGGIYTTDSDAKKARGLFHNEAKKTFIGEPYGGIL